MLMAPKLLLADDSVTIQRVIALTFAEEDVEVVTVSDGQQAIDRIDVDPPDIVLADIDMPKRDGYEVAAYIKSRPQLAHIPVVLLTGAFEPVDQARAAASGSSDVFTKPFEPQMVINRVKELLGRKRSETPDASQTPPTFPVQPARSGPARPPQVPAGESSGDAKDAGGSVSLDDYFDQLDAAFANMHGDRPAAQAPAAPAATPPIRDTSKNDASANDEFDWMTQPPAAKASAPPQPAVQQPARPAPPAPAPPPQAVAPPPAPARPTPAPSQPPSPGAPNAGPTRGSRAWDPSAAAALGIGPKDPAAFARASASLDEAHKRSEASLDVAPQSGVGEAALAAARPAAPPSRPASNPFAALSAATKTEAAAAAPAVITDEIIEEVCARVLSRLSDRVIRETVAAIVSQVAEQLVREEIERIKTGGQ
jgi:CheY-like chemotaxis protein